MRILIVGAGGIGSWFSRHLANALSTNQIPVQPSEVTIADDDDVEEKNLRYQDFTEEDLYDNKATILGDRYGFTPLTERVTDISQHPTSVIISCVDNTAFRKELFTTCHSSGPFWIDLRSEGSTVAAFCKHPSHTKQSLLDTLPVEVAAGSCQRAEDLTNNTIQLGNVIIASIGMQFLLNYYRKTSVPAKYIHTF